MSDSSLQHVDPTEIGSKARSGAFWSALQIIGRNVLSIGTTALLARMLAPEDYGLMGMVATLTVLLLVFSDMGLSWATVQRRDLSSAQVSNLFWINAIVGLVLWAGCIAVAPFLALFYGEPQIESITMVMGATFLIGGLAVQPFALMRRRMEFRQIAWIEIGAVVTSAIVAIIAAAGGMGYWALVIQALAGQVFRLITALPVSGMQLHLPRSRVGTKSMVTFGGLLALNGLLIYVARHADSVLIGRFFGAEELGYYDRAYFLMLLPSTLATGVLANLMVPSLSALQDEQERFASAYRRALRMVAFVGCPLAAGLALVAHEAVLLVYGDQWSPVATLLVWLSIAGVTQPIYNTTGWLFTAKAKGKQYFGLTVMNAVALVAALSFGVKWGAVGVAQAYGLMMGLVLIWPSMWLAHRAAGLSLFATIDTLRPVASCLVLMSAVVLVVGWASDVLGLPWWVVLLVKIASGVVAYGVAAVFWAREIIFVDVIPMLPKRMGRMVAKVGGIKRWGQDLG